MGGTVPPLHTYFHGVRRSDLVLIVPLSLTTGGPDSSVGIANRYGAGRSGDRIL